MSKLSEVVASLHFPVESFLYSSWKLISLSVISFDFNFILCSSVVDSVVVVSSSVFSLVSVSLSENSKS